MLIEINDLIKKYLRHDGAINAVDTLSLSIPKGSFVTITGPSGSGKTTLLLIMGGLLKPTSGNMSYEKKVLNLHKEEEMANFRSDHVGYVMQSFALIPYLTALENITIAMNVKRTNRSENLAHAMFLLKWVGLEDRISHYPKELSAGQQQRVAIARALANNPDLLLADEPTGNLDPKLSLEILEILKDINQKQGTTVIMVTHSPMAADFGKMKINLENGKIQHL